MISVGANAPFTAAPAWRLMMPGSLLQTLLHLESVLVIAPSYHNCYVVVGTRCTPTAPPVFICTKPVICYIRKM
jgi:hypothetical protein